MSVKDGLGNELVVGDMVLIHLNSPFVIGQVMKLSDGGIDLASAKGQKTPGLIQILCPENIAFQPGPHARISAVFKVVNPESAALAEKFAERVNLGTMSNVVPMKSTEPAPPDEKTTPEA